MWLERKDIFTGPIGPWIGLLGLLVISLLWLEGERLLYTLRFCCIGSIHVDRGSLFRCLLRNAALGDLETALDRRAQKRVPDARSLTERFDAYLKALRHCRISIRSMTAVWSRPVIR